MFEKYLQRENLIFEVLQEFMDKELEFILIGGYAVSAYKHRFSVDADIVIKTEDFEKFKQLLERRGFKETISKDLDNLYSSKFRRFEKKEELTTSFDLLIGGMGIRQTDSAISFEKIKKNSVMKTIKGTQRELRAKVGTKELLIAAKLQAGRLTDFRDIAALCRKLDMDKIKDLLGNTNKRILKEHIAKLMGLLDKKEFMDSFKGVFIEKRYDIDVEEIKKLEKVIE